MPEQKLSRREKEHAAYKFLLSSGLRDTFNLAATWCACACAVGVRLPGPTAAWASLPISGGGWGERLRSGTRRGGSECAILGRGTVAPV